MIVYGIKKRQKAQGSTNDCKAMAIIIIIIIITIIIIILWS
jgi:hypothetical protein